MVSCVRIFYFQYQVNVPRGSLLALAERSADISRVVTVVVKVVDIPGVKASVMTKQMREFSSQQSELLAAVRGPEDRYTLLDSRRLKVRMGDRVVFCAPGDPPVPAIVRFLGAVPDLRSRGYLLGLEITLEDWGLGETDGSVGGRRYFNTDPSRGVFCDVSKVRIEEIHSKEKLESLNRGTVGRITAMIDNNNMVKNVNMMKDKRDGDGRDGVVVERVKLANVQRIGEGHQGHYQVKEIRLRYKMHKLTCVTFALQYFQFLSFTQVIG